MNEQPKIVQVAGDVIVTFVCPCGEEYTLIEETNSERVRCGCGRAWGLAISRQVVRLES